MPPHAVRRHRHRKCVRVSNERPFERNELFRIDWLHWLLFKIGLGLSFFRFCLVVVFSGIGLRTEEDEEDDEEAEEARPKRATRSRRAMASVN